MAKKIYNDLINPQIKPNDLDLSMFNKPDELDLSMFDSVKKNEDSDSTSEVRVSASKELGSVPSFIENKPEEFDLRYNDYLSQYKTLSLQKPNPIGYNIISDKINIDLLDLAAKTEASKPVKTSYIQGIPKELNKALSGTVRWIGERMIDVDKVLGSVPSYLNMKMATDALNPNRDEQVQVFEDYFKEKDPVKKNELSIKYDELRRARNPLVQFADDIDRRNEALYGFPDTFGGAVAKGVVDVLPMYAGLMLTPEVTLPKIFGTALKIPKFATFEGVKGFYSGATKEGSVKDKIKASAVGTVSGLATGTFLHGLGVTSQQLGNLVGSATKSSILRGGTAATANGLGFGLFDSYSQLAATGEIDVKQSLASGMTGFVLGVPQIAGSINSDVKNLIVKRAYEKASKRYWATDDNVIQSVQQMGIDPVSLREKSNQLAEMAEKETDPSKKNDLLSNKKIVDSMLDIHAMTNDVILHPEAYKTNIKNSDLPEEYKQEFLNKIDKTIENNNLIRAEVDNGILASREAGVVFKEPELFISEETAKVFEDIELDMPVINKRLGEASQNLYDEYNRLELAKNSQTRRNTVDEINEAQKFLEKQITNLENQKNLQREKDLFFNFKSRGKNNAIIKEKEPSDTNIPPKEDNASTTLLDTQEIKKPEGDIPLQNIQENAFDLREKQLSLQYELDKQNKGSDSQRQSAGVEYPRTDSSRPVEGKPRFDVGGNRLVDAGASVKEFSLSDKEATDLTSHDPDWRIDKSFTEIKDANLFTSAISESKKGNPFSASVWVYTPEEYAKSRLFLTNDGKAGAAITQDGTIISVFSHGDGKGRAPQLVVNAIKEGGVKLDHYNTILTKYYSKFGFVPVAKVKFDPELAPSDWNKETYKKFNNGEPDVVLMAYHGGDPNTLSQRVGKFGDYQALLEKAPYVKTFEEGQKLQEEYVKKVKEQNALNLPQGEQVTESKEPSKEAPKETLQEVKQPKISDILEKEEVSKKSEAGFLPFFLSLPILRNPRAKRRALDIKQAFREQFLPSRGMPKAVYDEFLKTKGKINARRFDIERSANKAKEDLYKAYGDKLTPEQKEEIEVALENLGTSKASKDIAFNILTKNIPKEAQGTIEKMRNMIDSYSDDIKKLDMIGAGLEGKIDQNTGYYVNRTYRKHTDRDWTWETIPLKIKEDAANKLLEIFPKLTPDEALGMAKEIVETQDFKNSVIQRGNSLADIDKGALKKRSLFLTDNPEIRALLGENRDPLYNYAVSLTKMAEIAERGKMLENIRDIGLAEGFLSETQSLEKNHIAQIQYNEGVFKGKLGSKPLSAYYTTPEIAKSISSFMKPSSPPGWRVYMRLITTTKIAKTAGSIKGVVRNFKSNTTNAIANANWNVPAITKYLATAAKDKTAWTEFSRELREENIIGDSANAGELIKNVEELSNRISTVTKTDESFGEMLKRTTVDKALKVYGGADDVWKVYRYVSEKIKYKDAFINKGMTGAEAEVAAKKEASKILHKTSTYYSELPLFIQNMRKLPFSNTFISFPYLTTVNFIGGLQQAFKEIKDPYLRHIGLQRMAGTIAATYVLTATSQFRNRQEGVDEKDLEAWRRFLPDYWKNDIITIKKDNGDGTAEYHNTSYMDYYGAITAPMAMLRRKLLANGTLTDEDLIDAATEFSKSFIGWDIAFDKLTQIKANQDDLGRQIFNPQDDWDDKWKDMLSHLWGAVEPGTLTDFRRIYKTYREGGDWEGQLKGMMTGSQARTIDPLRSMDFYMLPKYKEQMDNARAIYKNQLRQYKRLVAPTDADNKALQDAKQRSEAISNTILSEIVRDYDAAIRVGVKQDKLEDVIRGEKFDRDITNAILYRTGVMLDEDGGFLEDTSKTNN